MDEIQMIMNRIDDLENNMKEYVSMCQANCGNKIQSVSEVAEKAHFRLDKQKESIECLNAHKNKEVGFRRAITWIMTAMGIVIAYMGLKGVVG